MCGHHGRFGPWCLKGTKQKYFTAEATTIKYVLRQALIDIHKEYTYRYRKKLAAINVPCTDLRNIGQQEIGYCNVRAMTVITSFRPEPAAIQGTDPTHPKNTTRRHAPQSQLWGATLM